MTEPEFTRAVFVPGLMGAGFLLSAALLLADAVGATRRLAPNRGVRRKVLVAQGVRAVVEDVAQAAGRDVSRSSLFRREPRSPWTYLSVGAAVGALGAIVGRAGTDAYFGPGRFHGNIWPLSAGLSAGALLGALALLGFVLAFSRNRLPQPIDRLVASTWMGRLRPPPEDRRERAVALVAELSENATRKGERK